MNISLNQPDATFLTSASFWTFEIKGLHAIAPGGAMTLYTYKDGQRKIIGVFH